MCFAGRKVNLSAITTFGLGASKVVKTIPAILHRTNLVRKMPQPDRFSFPKLHEKGISLAIPVHNAGAWQNYCRTTPGLTTNFEQLRAQAAKLFPASHRASISAAVSDGLAMESEPTAERIIEDEFPECGEDVYQNFFNALGNPAFTLAERRLIESDMDGAIPEFEQELMTDHFTLKWTNSSENVGDNIPDRAVVEDTASFLETAWNRMSLAFGRSPYVPEGGERIEILFRDIETLGYASPPDGPINFDAASWISTPGIRKPTSAHELFHKLQYAFGYRTKWTPTEPFQWFSEGSASWAEAYIWQQLSRASKLTKLFSTPDFGLYNSSYDCLPFWMFFQMRQSDASDSSPMVSFLEKYDLIGDEQLALRQVIEENWPLTDPLHELHNFFALFSFERITNNWRNNSNGEPGYPIILGPDESVINTMLSISENNLGVGAGLQFDNKVDSLASDYFRFLIDAGTTADSVQIQIDPAVNVKLSCSIAWESPGDVRQTRYFASITQSFSFAEPLVLTNSNILLVVVTGRESAGQYSLRLQL